jgi:hypothetical protein
MDVVRLFIKKEPHGAKKIVSKRWRIISCLSLVDQILDRILHTGQNKLEILLHSHIPSCSGLGFDTVNDIEEFKSKVSRNAKGGKIASADVSGFDWSVQEWELLFDADCRIALAHAENTAYAVLVIARIHCICRSVLATDDGTMYAQTAEHYGIQKSGTFNTASTNSRIRIILAWLIGADWAIAMGDDCLEEPVDDATAKYALYGHPLKMYDIQDGRYEFCSHYFSENGVYPSNPAKSVFRLLSHDVISADLMTAMIHFMRAHPDLAGLLSLLQQDERLTAEALEVIEVWQNNHGKKEKRKERQEGPTKGAILPS